MKQFIVKKRAAKQYEQFTCRIEGDLLKEIKQIVVENDLESINKFINECLEFALKNVEIKDNTNEGK